MGMATSGVLGKPRMLASCSVACDANNLTFKALGRFWGVPHVYVDVPYDVSRDSALYVADELRELARVTEDAFSRKLDEGRLREVCACSERTMHELAATLPTRRGRYLANTMLPAKSRHRQIIIVILVLMLLWILVVVILRSDVPAAASPAHSPRLARKSAHPWPRCRTRRCGSRCS